MENGAEVEDTVQDEEEQEEVWPEKNDLSKDVNNLCIYFKAIVDLVAPADEVVAKRADSISAACLPD